MHQVREVESTPHPPTLTDPGAVGKISGSGRYASANLR
jgi:hypothetical protein